MAVLAAVPGGSADEATSILSLSEALQRAAAHNPDLNAARYHERAAEARTEQAFLRPNPILHVTLENFGGTGALHGVDGIEATVQASQQFERGGKRHKRVAVARRDRDIVAGNLDVQRSEVLTATTLAYIETLAGQQRLSLAAGPLDLARETLAAAEARVKAGDASPAEPARARATLAAAQLEYARAESALIRARATLAAQWGQPAEDVPVLQGAILVPGSLPAENTLRPGLRDHPRLRLQQAIIASRRSSLELEQAQASSDVTVGAGVHFLRNGSDAGMVAGFSVPLSFRNQNQGHIRAARENLHGAEQSVAAVENRLQAEFTAAWQELTAAHTAVQNLRHDALPATQEAHAHVRRAYAEGHLPLIDVLDAQRALITLQRELLEAETTYMLSLARLESLSAPAFPLTTATLSSQ
jgi:outer membrane protein, heavy metal efflux system